MNIWQRLISALARAFKVGPLVVSESDRGWGKSQEDYAPAVYGDYLATVSAVYAASNLRAKNLGQLPLRLWRLRNGDKVEVDKGQLYELLQKVNPFWTFKRLQRMTELSLCAWGQAFWVLERGENGTKPPSEIWWVRPDRMRIIPHPTDYIAGYIYEYQGQRIPFTAKEVIWFPYDNPMDEYSGLSPIASARLGLDTGRSALKSNKMIFDQGMQMAGVISPADPNKTWPKEEMERFQEMLAKRFKGVDKAHRVAVLSHAARFDSVNLSPKDAQFLELMKWAKQEVAMVYGIAPELLGDHEHATYSNMEQAEKALWMDTIIPEASFFADILTEQLLPLFPGQADLAEFDLSGVSMLQEDRTEIVDQMVKLGQLGVPLNVLLQEFQPNLLPPGKQGYPWGDTWWAPMTLLPAGSTPPPEAERMMALDNLVNSIEVNARHLPLALRQADPWGFGSSEHERLWRKFERQTEQQEEKWVDALREYFRRQQESVLARLRQGERTIADALGDPFDEAVWGKRLKELGYPLLQFVFRDGFDALVEEMGFGLNFDLKNPETVRWLEKRAQRFAREVNDTTWETLKRGLGEGIEAGEGIPELSERVKGTFADASTRRAQTIARTETISAANAGSLQAARDSGVVKGKRWLSAMDERVRETHLSAHGQVVGLEEDFEVGAGRGPAPGQIGLAEEDIQCRCSLTYVLK